MSSTAKRPPKYKRQAKRIELAAACQQSVEAMANMKQLQQQIVRSFDPHNPARAARLYDRCLQQKRREFEQRRGLPPCRLEHLRKQWDDVQKQIESTT